MNEKRNDDSDLIDDAGDLPVPSHQGSSGGNLAREVGQRDEDKTAMGEDPENTRVQASDKPANGDRPTLPQNHR